MDCFIKGNSIMRPVRTQAVCLMIVIPPQWLLDQVHREDGKQSLPSSPAWITRKRRSNYIALRSLPVLAFSDSLEYSPNGSSEIDSASTPVREECPTIEYQIRSCGEEIVVLSEFFFIGNQPCTTGQEIKFLSGSSSLCRSENWQWREEVVSSEEEARRQKEWS